jgi:hypothetical protein
MEMRRFAEVKIMALEARKMMSLPSVGHEEGHGLPSRAKLLPKMTLKIRAELQTKRLIMHLQLDHGHGRPATFGQSNG